MFLQTPLFQKSNGKTLDSHYFINEKAIASQIRYAIALFKPLLL
ncbi:hypothetical protein [Microseira sp. BLCC-F43]